MSKEIKTSLAHATWNYKYHIVFAPKYRRKAFYGEKRAEMGGNSEKFVREERSFYP